MAYDKAETWRKASTTSSILPFGDLMNQLDGSFRRLLDEPARRPHGFVPAARVQQLVEYYHHDLYVVNRNLADRLPPWLWPN
jgi:hypothetical protein